MKQNMTKHKSHRDLNQGGFSLKVSAFHRKPNNVMFFEVEGSINEEMLFTAINTHCDAVKIDPNPN